MRLLFASGWLASEQKQEEIDVKLCQQAAIALGMIESTERVVLPDGWGNHTHPPIKRNAEVARLMADSNGSLDAFLASLQFNKRPSQQKKYAPSTSSHDVSMESMLKNIAQVRRQLAETVIGQDDAIEAVCDGLSKQFYCSNENAPAAVFLFVGSTATGKTLLSTTLAKALGDDWESISVAMENMTSSNEGFAINGLTKGYSAAAPGKITGFVKEHPRSVVVFENFDKAHPNVRSVIEPLFTTGFITDQFGFYERDSEGEYDFSKQIAEPDVSFREAIVIFTSKAGEEAYSAPSFEKIISTRPEQLESIILSELSRLDGGALSGGTRNTISPSFLAGLASGSTVLFRKMTLESMAVCASKSIREALDKLKTGLKRRIGYEAIEMLSKALLMSFAPDVNALTTTNDLVQRLFDPLMDYIRDQQGEIPARIRIHFAEGQLAELKRILASFDGIDPVAQMFRKSKTLHVSIRTVAVRGVLYLELADLALQRVPQARDFRGAGAVRAEVPDIGFAQIAGHQMVKNRMTEIIALLKNPALVKSMDVDIPKGLLLWGPPGTGKTMLAKALAHEADLPFISTTGSELLASGFMKTIFKRARKYAPSILFIDEMDAIGTRGQGGIDVIINQLLIEIDGFDTSLSAPVFIVAATNLPEKIDAALTRSGRIDLKIEVAALDQEARMHFIDAYFKLPNDGSLDRTLLLEHTVGMSGADLEMVRREAVLAMVRAEQQSVTMDMIMEQIKNIKKEPVL
jgi:SpoVK/Ycf46/Vps4 family AAA+-type ATPase